MTNSNNVDPPFLDGDEVRRRAVSGVISLTLRSVLVRAMNFGGTIVLAHYLTPSEFGLTAFGLAIAAIGSFVASGGLSAALIRQPTAPTRLQLESVFGLQLGVACVALILVAAVGIPFGEAGAIAAVMSGSLVLDVLRAPAGVVAEREMNYAPLVRAEVTEIVAYNTAAVTLIVAGAGVWSIAVGVLVRAATGSTVLNYLSDVGLVRPRLDLEVVRPLYRFGLKFHGVRLVSLAREQGTNFAVIGLGGPALLGITSFAQRLLQPIALIFASGWRVSFPTMSRLIEAGEDPRATLQRGLRLASTTTALVVAALCAATPALVPSVFGQKWNPIIELMPWAVAGLLISGPIYMCALGYMSAVGEVGRLLRVEISAGVVWVALGAALIPSLQGPGVAIGWFVGGLVSAVQLGAHLTKFARVEVVSSILPSLGGATAAAALGWYVAVTLPPTLPTAIAAAGTAATAYVLSLILLQRSAFRDWKALTDRYLPRRSTTVT